MEEDDIIHSSRPTQINLWTSSVQRKDTSFLQEMKASFSVEGAFDTPLEKIRNASSLHAMTWGRRMKRSQQELPAYVSFSDSLNLRAFICHGSGLGVSNLSPININSGSSVTENTLSSIWHAAEEVSVESRLQVCPSVLFS